MPSSTSRAEPGSPPSSRSCLTEQRISPPRRGSAHPTRARVLREDARTDPAPRRHALYFCDFDLLPRAIAADPRSGDAMPCQITVVEDQTSVRLVAKPPGLGLENPDAPTRAVCAQARDLLVDILWEAAQ